MLLFEIQSKIKQNALLHPETEACGLVFENKTKNLDIFPCKNSALDKQNFFIINPINYLECSIVGNITHYYHSHPGKSENFSEYDKQISEQHNIKAILYLINQDKFLEYEPCGYRNKYCGRPFIMGSSDCFTLVKEYYFNELNITINDNLARDSKSAAPPIEDVVETLQQINPFLVSVDINNFKTLQKNDILIFSIEKDYPHIAILLENSTILHQKLNKDSVIEEYSSLYKKNLKYVFRAKNG